jgi:hypothetical protein
MPCGIRLSQKVVFRALKEALDRVSGDHEFLLQTQMFAAELGETLVNGEKL